MNIFDHFARVMEFTREPVVVEIGAADGMDTERYISFLKGLGRKFQYLAIEPEPNNHPKLEASPVREDFELHKVAIGDHHGTAPWHSTGPWPYSGSVKEPKLHLQLHADVKFQAETTVPMRTLDQICDRFSVVDWIWCDVQGTEDLVIAGGQQAFAKTHYFYTEYYEVEAYKDNINRDEIFKRLPGKWRIVEDWNRPGYGGDALFERFIPAAPTT